MAKSSCSISHISHAESQNEDSQELFENSDPEDNDDSNPLKEMANQSQTQSDKKLFPIFSLSQKKREAEDTNIASSGPAVAGCSIMSNVSSDFDTPKANRNPVIKPKKLSTEMKTSVEENLSKSRSSIPTERKSESVGWKPPPLSMSDHKDLAQDLLSLFLEKIDADITVYGREEKPIRAHKLILKARCPRLLKDIVTEKSSKSKGKEVIPLTCFSHTSVKSLMSYIYCGRILPPGFKISDLRERDLEEIKELGKKYGLDLSPPVPTSIRTEKVAKPTAKDVKEMDTQTTSIELDEKAVQTDTAEDLEFAREEERLNSLREDERSREYHCDSHLSYQGAYRPVFQRSPDLFEGSFNDRVFAHSLERSAAKKRRRSWSENRRMSVTESDSSESIILLDDDDDGDNIRKTPEEQHVQELEPEPTEPEPESKSESNHVQPVEDKVDDMFDDCPRSPWGRTYDDDAFFANLPADEELLDIPPTSPVGTKTYNSPFVPSPVRPTYQSPLTHKSPVKKAPAKRRPRNGKAAAGEKRLKTGRGRGKSSQVERSGDDDDMDSDSECANGISNGGYRSPRISASQGGGGVSSSQNVASKNQSTPMLNYSLIDTPILKVTLVFGLVILFSLSALPYLVLRPYL